MYNKDYILKVFRSALYHVSKSPKQHYSDEEIKLLFIMSASKNEIDLDDAIQITKYRNRQEKLNAPKDEIL